MAAPTSRDRRVPVLSLALLATPTSLSANSATTAIPDLARELQVSVADATWTATAFGWAAVVGTPLTAGLLRSRGPRVAVLVNAALVLLGTLLVALAPTLLVLLVGRAAQAAGGGGLVTLAIGLAATPRRTGAITAGVGLVGAFGPLAGSTLSEFSWRVALCLSLLALLAVPAVLRRLPEHHDPVGTSAGDSVGLVLVLGLASALVLVPRFPVAGLASGAAMGVLLARNVTLRPEGFVPRKVLRSHAFRVAATAACALSTAYFAVLYTVPLLLRAQWSSDRIGMITLIALAAGSTASLLATRYASRLGPVIMTAGAVGAALPLITTWPSAVAAATGFAVFAATAGMAWYAGVLGRATPSADRPAALGLLTLCYQLGGAFGPALATLLIS
ncbi:MFS transporter [Allokutzneria multivorans]